MKWRFFIQAAVLSGLMLMALESGSAPANPSGRHIAINGMRLPREQIQDVDRLLGYALPNGRYWHDVRTGSWGRMGGPSLGLMPEGYFQQTRAAVHARSHNMGKPSNQTLSISAMIDLNTDRHGPDHGTHVNH